MSSVDVATKRLMREAGEIQAAPRDGMRVHVGDKNFFVWTADVDGPEGTPYKGGIFKFQLSFREDYPFSPPIVKCLTKVCHVNINSQGDICLDLLKSKWTPLLSVSSILESLQQLLREPNPYDPLMPDLAAMMIKDPDQYYKKAKLFTKKFAH